MTRRRLKTLKTMRRVARVRELESRQELFEAMQLESAQRDLVHEAGERLQRAEEPLRNAVTRARIQLGRYRLDCELADVLSTALDAEQASLGEREAASEACMLTRARRKHRYSHLDAAATGMQEMQAVEKDRKSTDTAVQAWLQVRKGRRTA